ncbi:hypothetical protein F9L16_11070 [Agarivorans sp. B2Z047]|uniref:hypothetical protein n=1 Tax=Agarivorans sp. B2Z047 TaxID=2652721 RepID=UPI00128D3E88|nr:hypothetical protein [Agarivorans sp. B2Z047]MPW29540.1 hypothetical protein [Agarivorans sp. B2Z047]UQN45127.1 hypothetical protein LQZ07_11845 [Agarivorans sp. B2Z047]
MLNRMKYTLLVFAAVLGLTQQAHAGFIAYTDRAAFENAAGAELAFEGFNDPALLNEDLTISANRYRSTSSLVSEGAKALSIFESNTFTIDFEHDVFALGFDLNELNSSHLDYLDSAGHIIDEALKITDVWYESTFFGLISDTALRSFSLVGSGSSSAVYGFDALSYTAATPVPAPPTWPLMLVGLSLVLLRCYKRT